MMRICLNTRGIASAVGKIQPRSFLNAPHRRSMADFGKDVDKTLAVHKERFGRFDDFGKRFDDFGKRIDDLVNRVDSNELKTLVLLVLGVGLIFHTGMRIDEQSAKLNAKIDEQSAKLNAKIDKQASEIHEIKRLLADLLADKNT